MFYPGWKVKYQDTSGEEQTYHVIPFGGKLVRDFIDRLEANGGTLISIAFYASRTIGTIQPFYEIPITREELTRASDTWVEQKLYEIERDYPQV